MWVVIIIVAIIVLLLLVLVAMFNKLVRLRNRAENAWAQVDVQLRKRYDLIPNLVETVKGYASHERETFEAVTAARTAAQQAQGVQQQAQAENMLTAALGRLFAVAEAYPQLRATENFQQLQAQLSDVEENIAGRAPGLQRHGAELRQRAADGADEHHRGDVPLQPARVLPDRGGARARRRRSSFAEPAAAAPAEPAPPAPPRRPRRDPGAGARRGARRSPRSSCSLRRRAAPTTSVARTSRSRSRRTGRSSSGRTSRSAAPSTAPTATSRCARASRSTDPGERNGKRYTRGGSTELGSIDTPDTFNYDRRQARCGSSGTSTPPGRPRTFTVAYRVPRPRRSPTTTSSTSTCGSGATNWSSPLGDLAASIDAPAAGCRSARATASGATRRG